MVLEAFNRFLVSAISCGTRMGWSVTKYFYSILNRLLIFKINLVLYIIIQYMAIINFYKISNIKEIKLY